MKSRIFGLVFLATLSATLAACTVENEGPTSSDDEILTSGDLGKDDSLSSTSTYYTVRPDLRRCISPVCGGYWVKRVNLSSTRCADGRYAAECYVAEMDFSALGAGAEELQGNITAAFRGTIGVKTFDIYGKLGIFKATEAWLAGNPEVAPKGTFYRAKDNGMRCFKAPCFNIHEAKLNSTWHTNVSGVNLEKVGATPEQVEKALNALYTDSILVAGTNQKNYSIGGVDLVATQFYTKWQPKADDCRASGCPTGEYCTFCWVNYACIPEGAVC
ncbi:MAG: hypothetical protein HY698_07605 [Deltaproteobacteria bacterium]|nr:hypothetical protein [Deltaproteobacteria bacterium]